MASSFRVLNSSTGIPLLALLTAVLPKAHLTSLSIMWLTTWLKQSGSLRSFLYSSSVYSFHLFLISFASVMSLLFLSFIVTVPIFCPLLQRPGQKAVVTKSGVEALTEFKNMWRGNAKWTPGLPGCFSQMWSVLSAPFSRSIAPILYSCVPGSLTSELGSTSPVALDSE